MKIELKNTDFKNLYEWLIDHTDISTPKIGEMIHETLKPQYEKAFLKYKEKERKFNYDEKVKFQLPNGKWKNGMVWLVEGSKKTGFTYVISHSSRKAGCFSITRPLSGYSIRKLNENP